MAIVDPWLGDARSASAQTNVWVSVILAQWINETGGFSSPAFVRGNNYAGVSYSGVSSFPSKAAGLSAYIQVMNQSWFAPIRNAHSQGWRAQCVALGANTPVWAESRYDEADWKAHGSPQSGPWTANNPGIDLITLVNQYNLTQYDPPGSAGSQPPPPGAGSPQVNLPVGSILQPPPGLASSVILGQFFINGTSFDIALGNALVTAQLALSATEASTLVLTIADPDGVILASGIFDQKSVVEFATTSLLFSQVSVEKQGTVLTATYESWVVAALRTATGPYTVAPGRMTRTQFAAALVLEVQNAGFLSPPDSYLYAQNAGYDRATQEVISRGTSDNPGEDSWTALQRLAQEIQFICFENFGEVFFGPEEWLTLQPPVLVPVEGISGIDEINGTYDIGQTDGSIEITAAAGSWFGQIGDCIKITNMGPFDGNWYVSAIEREDMEEVDITITCSQFQPSLPEPTSGGAAAAVGAGTANVGQAQTQGGTQAAQQAIKFCVEQLGKPYVFGGSGPTVFDCSGLVMAAYAVSGIPMAHNSVAQFKSNMYTVPPGINNLKPGDLVFFAGGDPPPPGHVGIVTSVNVGTNTVTLIDAYSSHVPLNQQIRYDTFAYPGVNGATAFAGTYYGAKRPAP